MVRITLVSPCLTLCVRGDIAGRGQNGVLRKPIDDAVATAARLSCKHAGRSLTPEVTVCHLSPVYLRCKGVNFSHTTK